MNVSNYKHNKKMHMQNAKMDKKVNNQNQSAKKNIKFSASNNSTPDTETFSEQQHQVDTSESDEESVSEVDSFPLDHASTEELPDDDSCSESDNDHDDENDEEDEDESSDIDSNDEEDEEEEDDDEDMHAGSAKKFLLADDKEIERSKCPGKVSLKEYLEAAVSEKIPVLRNAQAALDDAAQTITRMRSDVNPRDKNLLSRTLIAACTDNDVNAVRRLLIEGNTLNDATDDGDSLLSLACSAGYYELAQVLLAMSAQVEDRGQKNDCTPLMEAASAGHIEIIELLIRHGADVNAQSSTGNTPLMYACAGGHVAAVKTLLAHGANVEDHNENGHTPLMEAASAGHVEVAKILLDHGAGINTHSNEFKESALTLACYKGHLDMVRFLLEAGADQEHKTDEMHTALMEASMDGHVEVARLLLDSGAQVNMPTDSFESPLTLAACGGHVDLAMLLIERGANIEEVNDEGYTPLMEAAREGHDEMVSLLLTQGANINAQTEETQETALTLACCGGFLEVADYLIKHGADIELGASTPLMEAAQEGHLDLVKFLLENKADVHAQTQTGDTALTYACENGHTDVAEVLLYYGAELEHLSEGGRTPLMKACRAGHICTVKFLIQKGADVNRQTTNNDHTPLSLASAGGHQQVVELLLSHGSDPFHKLKDNSTMLIEAAKGGHTSVVQLLLDFPQTAPSGTIPQQQQQQQLSSAGNQLQLQAPPLNMVHIKQQQHQQQQLKLLQQQQQQPHLQHQHHQLMAQQQLLQAPPGLHDVTDVIRLPDPPGMFQQHLHMVGENIQELPAASTKLMSPLTNQNFTIDPNILAHGHATAAASVQQSESILTQMKLLQSAGFKDGLAYGLTKAQSAVSQIVNQQQQQNNINNINPTGINPQHQQIIQNNLCMPSSSSSGGSSNNNKQKNVSRKNRQLSSPFTDGTMSTAEIPRLERTLPISEEEVIYLRNTLEEQIQQKLDNTLQKNIQFINDSGPPQTLLPSGTFVDITTPAQGKQGNNTFMPSTFSSVGQLVINTDNANTSATGTNTNNLTAGGVNANKLTHITAPSEVSQSTAISDRPKAKPVSKKDAKNSRKLTNTLQQQHQQQQNSMPAPPNVDLTKPKTELTDTTTKSDGTIEMENVPAGTVLPRIFDLDTFFEMRNLPDLKAHWSQKQIPPNIDSTKQLDSSVKADVGLIENEHVTAASSGTIQSMDDEKSLDAAGTRNCSRLVDLETFQKMRLNNLSNRSAHWDPKVFKKIAQLIDPPKSPIEQLPSNTPPLSPKTFSSDMGDYSHMFDEIPALQRKMILERLTTKEMKNNHDALKCALDLEQTFGEELTNSIAMSLKREENKSADVFPSLEQSLDSFIPDDVSGGELGEDTHGPIYNYEWVDEVMQALNVSPDISNAFHVRNSQWDLSVNDVNIMKLQEIAANINNQDLESYASLFGINTICKSKWGTPHWPQSHFPGHHLTSDCSSPTNDDSNLGMLEDEEDVKNDLATQNLLMTIDQQRFPPQLSMEQLHLINQLQHQQQAMPHSSATLDQQDKPNILLSGQQAISGFSGTQATQLHPGTAQKTVLTDAQQQTNFVFNVETDQTSKSLQLLFQLPSSVQDGQNQQQQQIPQIKVGSALKTATVHPQNVAISTQTQAPPPSTTTRMFPQPGFVNYQQQQQQQQQQTALMHPQPRLWSKNYSQVQVSSGTQTNPAMMTQIPGHHTITPGACDEILTPSTPPSNKSTNVSVTIGAKKASSTTSAAAAASGGATSEKVSRKEKSRNGVRPVPAGGQNNYQFDNNTGLPSNYPNIPGSTSTGTTTDRTIDVDSETDSNHDTALTLACAGGHEDLVELLIKRGSNIEHRDKKGFTPLILAATAGHEKVVHSLINCGAELEAQSERTKDTPLSLACSGGRYEVVELLLKVGANKEHRNVSDYTPLSLAASGGYVNIIKLLLNNGAEINSRTGSKLGISPLMLAAMNGHTAAVRLLLDMGSDINAQIETNRNTALTLACFQGRNEVVSLLLDRKANVEHRAKTGLTPLMEAASGGYIEVGRVLLDKGADVNAAPVPSSRDTALTIAADKGHLKFVELLLSRCAAVEVKNKKGNSPLWLAANGGHLGVVEALYNARADIDSQDNRKVSCLMAAFRKGHTKVVKWMVNHVTQFPSDQEMTRYINVVEKEVIDKCHECVKIIRAAKETQAAKANINASILLKELDMEKSREESRKAAAAKRRERKKRRKQEKREAQRKLVEGDQPEGSKNHQKNKNQKTERDEDDSDDSDSDKDDSNDEDDDDVEDEIVPANEKEEGDSGIDANSQGSCSSSDAKGATTKATLAVVLEANIVNSKKVIAKNANQRKKNQPIIVAATAEASTSNSANNSKSSSNRSSSSPAPLPIVKAVPEPAKPIREDIRKTRDQQRDLKNQRVPETTQKLPVASKITNEKENIAPKEIEKPVVKIEKKTEYTSSVTVPAVAVASTTREYTQKTSTYENSSAVTSGRVAGRGKPTVVFGNSRLPPIDREDYEIDYFKPSSSITKPKSSTSPTKQQSSASSITKMSQQTQSQQQQQRNNAGVEEEWKEVVRKCSVQQTGSGATTSATPAVPSANEIGCKKIQVPLNAISRVIGRGGSNINAIRAATGAHIEVEKQGKTQGDRSITIKGVAEATKQAHNLIATLIKDPDADILSMLPRNNLMPSKPTISSVSTTTPVPLVTPTVTAIVTLSSQAAIINGTNVWEKSLNSVVSVGNAVKTTTFSASSKSVSAPGNSGAIGVVVSKATTPTQQLSANKTPTIRSSVAKNLFSGQIPIMRPLPNQTGGKILLSDGAKKGIIATPTATATKTSTSIASSIQALKNSIQNAPTVTVVTSASTGGSFASKLGSNTMENTKKQLLTGMPSAIQNNRSRDNMQSPSKQQAGINSSSVLPTPFTNNQSVPTSVSSGNMNNKSIYDSSVSGTTTTTTITRSITPIGPPSRNITSSPHSLHIVNTLDLSTPSMGWNNNVDITHHLQHKMNDLHVSSAQALEYSLFNDNYISKWAEHKSNMVFNPLKVSAPFIESEPPVQVDASKAPGYRGNAINSPVSSKASSNSATPPSTVLAPQTSTNNSSASAAVGGPMNSSNTPAGVQNQSNNQTSSYGEMNVIKPIGQGLVQPPGQGLAVQRPSNNNSGPNRSMDFGRSNLFDPLYSSDSMQQSQYNSSQSHFGMNSSSQQPTMSRLNPKASAFSSVTGNATGGKMSSNQFGGNYNNMAPPANNNSFMKSPGGGRDGSGNGMSQYNRPSMQQQQQQQNLQQQGSRGWFQDLGNLGGTMDMSGSPSMSPNNNSQPPPQQQQQQQQHQQQQQQNNANGPPPSVGSGPQGQDDRKAVPRPIGTERQSWKYSYGPYGNSGAGGPTPIQQQVPQHPGSVGGNILEIDSSMVGSNANGTPWIMDKNQQQQQQQQQHPWQMPPHQPPAPYTFVRNLYDDIHMQDLMSQYPMDYSTGAQQQQQQQQQQQSGLNYMRPGGTSGATANGQQYHTFMGGDMSGNMADMQQYDFEKPTWSATKWTH